jgi:Raf kinase inhibitor-like YbhB/YbcL family protein
MRRSRTGIWGAGLALVVGAAALTACDTDDGREMRPPTSYQEWVLQGTSPSTAPTTVPVVPDITIGPETQPTVTAPADLDDTPAASATELPGVPTSVASSMATTTTTVPDTLPDLADQGVVFAAPFPTGSELNPAYTCDGAGINPQLTWTAPPVDTVELVVAVVDPDAPRPGGGPFVHYLVIGLPADPGTVGGNNPAQLGREVANSAGTVGWTPPCPPRGERHTYEFTLYALDQATELPADAPPGDQLTAIEGSAIGSSTVTATYERPATTPGS